MKFSLRLLLLSLVVIATTLASSMYDRRAEQAGRIYGQPTLVQTEGPVHLDYKVFMELTPAGLAHHWPHANDFVVVPNSEPVRLLCLDARGEREWIECPGAVRLSVDAARQILGGQPLSGSTPEEIACGAPRRR